MCLGLGIGHSQVTGVVPWVLWEKQVIFSSHSTVILSFRDLNKGLALFKNRVEIACLLMGRPPGKGNSIKVIRY